MKRLTLLAILATPAFAHEMQPETKFFQEEIAKNPMVQNVLTWCSLIGLEKEEACREEMYRNGKFLDPVRLEAATKCVEKSGLKYRVAFDKFFNASSKNPSLVSHETRSGDYHLYPAKGPKGTEWEKEHYYYYTAVDRQETANIKAREFVTDLKGKTEEILTTWKGGGEFAVGVKVSPSFLSAKLGEVNGEIRGLVERAVQEGRVTQGLLDEAWDKGSNYGKMHPESTGRKPGGNCDVGGECYQIDKKFPESQLQVAVNEDVIPKPATAATPTVAAPSAPRTSGQIAPDPFAPFTSGTATGGMPTDLKEKEKTESPKPKDKNENSTPIDPSVYLANLNDCASREEAKLYQEMGSKTIDPDAQTKEEIRAEQEAKLANGFCDESYWGSAKCAEFQYELTTSEAENAEREKEEAFRTAMETFQSSGICDSRILGFDFCSKARFEADAHRAEPEFESIGGTITNPETIAPQPMDCWNPEGCGLPSISDSPLPHQINPIW